VKPLLAVAAMLAITAPGVDKSAAQTSSVAVGSPGPTTPLGTNLGDFQPEQQTGAAGLPYSGAPVSTPCSTGQQGQSTLSAFDGGGINLSTNVPTNGTAQSELPGTEPPGSFGVGTAASPCNSVSSSGIASPGTPVTATSSPSSLSTSGSATAATNTAATYTNADGLGTSTLGVGTLGSASQAAILPLLCQRAPNDGATTTTSSALSGSTMPNDGTTTSVGDDGDFGAVVDNQTTQGPATGPYVSAQTLAGDATQPMMRAAGPPCLTGGE
jgi:hypothetical protein